MRISRHNIIIGSLSFILIAGLSSILFDDSSHLSQLVRERLVEKEALFDEMRKMKSSPLEKMVNDYTYWDDMVNYVRSPNERWAQDNIDSSFATYDLQSLWVYRNDGVMIRSVRKKGAAVEIGEPFSLPVKRVDALLGGSNFARFCVATPLGLMEIYAAPIRSTLAGSGSGTHGLLLAGILLDEKYLGELSLSSRSTVSLREYSAGAVEELTDPRMGIVSFSRDLPGLDGRPLKTLAVRMAAPDIQHIIKNRDMHAVLGTGLIALLYVLAGVVMMSRHRLKIANQNLDAAQKVAKMGSWQRSIATGVGSWSDNLYNLFGLPRIGTRPCLETFYPLVHPEDLPRVKRVIEQAVADKEGHEVEFRLIRPDGDVRIMRSKGSVVMVDGVKTQIVGYTQDITDIAAMTNELVALNSQKDGLITMLDHDLRTPLTPLTILLPMIKKRVGDPELKRLVDLCSKSTASMRNIADKARLLVSLFTAVRSGEFERVSLVSVIEQSFLENAGILEEKNINCKNEVDPSVAVQVIPVQIKELFSNLISNAVRFSSENGTIRITAERLSGAVVIAVNDDGVGLDSDHLERIFDEFFKADQSRHDLSAPGLGLAICRRIVRNHHGRIWAESPGVGRGTTIRFTLQ